MLFKFLGALVKYLRLRMEGVDLTPKCISRRESKILWAGSWFFFFFCFVLFFSVFSFSLFTQPRPRQTHHFLMLGWLSFPAQCSRTCGGGVQRREVLCKQRMADGSFLELPETFCSASKLASQQSCKKEDCPSEWLLSDWSEVCVVGVDEKAINNEEKKAPQINTYRRQEQNKIILALRSHIIVTTYTILCD